MSYIEMEEPPVKQVAVHPKVSVMVNAAITTLAEKKGSSLHAINRYITANYNVDAKKMSVYIKKYLKSAVESGELVQPTGKGASGSFKMNKQKVATEPKVPKVKSAKPLKMQTSTPKKKRKPAKASTPDKSPVKRMKSADDEEAPANSTFKKPNAKITKKPKVSVPTKSRKSRVSLPAKVKKPKKLMAKKVKESKVDGSLKGKPANTTTSPKPLKPKGTAKSTKAKQTTKPGKPAASVAKKAVSKKTTAEAEQK